MKKQMNLRKAAALVGIVVAAVAAGAPVVWIVAGVLGLALSSVLAKHNEPKLVPVRGGSQKISRLSGTGIAL